MKIFRNKIFIIITILLICTFSDANELVHVSWVDDGDTIRLEDGRRIRLLGINTPEIKHKNQKAEPYGNKARDYLKELLLYKKIRLESDHEKHDQYNRILAYVFLVDGTFINEKMIVKGFAFCLPKIPNNRYKERLLKAQQEAMDADMGLWKIVKNKPDKKYIGNTISKRFHELNCSFGKKTRSKNRIHFNRQWDAFYNGFSPCKMCIRFE